MNTAEENGRLRAALVRIAGELMEAGISVAFLQLTDYDAGSWHVTITTPKENCPGGTGPWARNIQVRQRPYPGKTDA